MTDQAASSRLRNPHPRLVLAVILTCQLMVVLDGTVVTIALPHIRTALGFSATSLSWVLNAYTLAFGGLLLLGARTGDIVGRRLTFVGGLAIFTVASLIGGLAHNSAELLVGRAGQGVGGALASPAALALLMSKFADGRERTRAVGLYTAVSVGGSAVGLVLGGMLVQWTSWRWVMFVNVPIGVAVVAVGWLVLSESDNARVRGRFDLLGALTSTIGMAALVYGFVRAASDGWGDVAARVAFAVGAILLIAFVITERRAVAPITPLRLFADRDRSASYVARLLVVAGTMGMFFFLTQLLQNRLHYSPITAGVAFLPITIMLFASSQAASHGLIDRFGAKPLMIVGIALTAVGVLWLTQLSTGSHYGSVFGPLMIIGTGNGLAFVPLTTAALHAVPDEDAGAASGMVNAMQQVGGSLGLAVLVTVFGAADRHALHHHAASLHGTAVAAHAYLHGADTVFAVATGFLVLTLLVVAVVIRSEDITGRSGDNDELLETLEVTGSISATASS
jgi:EmrB/QacA subfamily drug resistance transporter